MEYSIMIPAEYSVCSELVDVPSFTGYNLSDKPALDALKALSLASETHELEVVGGFAVRMYVANNCGDKDVLAMDRRSKDIDVDTTEHYSKPSFRSGIGKELAGHLYSMGYYPYVWTKGRRNFGVDVTNEDPNGVLFLSLPRRSDKNYQIFKDIVKREYDNAVELPVPGYEKHKLKVIRPEDIVPAKLHRLKPKDFTDITMLLKVTKDSDDIPFDWRYFREADLQWCGGVDKLVEDDITKLKKLRECL
ncbi:MAG: nucleotidyl transferase AbiEii/AbiGii toxin family protein [Candidatus Aenigmarchaeota archaeon]|nr:nucleotidyl transferase AbiEii/AbiGii toxin family protein [Candidatus Aenigmarchaeota archaeon]